MGTSVRNLKGKRRTVAKMCCLVQRAIFYSGKIITLQAQLCWTLSHISIHGRTTLCANANKVIAIQIKNAMQYDKMNVTCNIGKTGVLSEGGGGG